MNDETLETKFARLDERIKTLLQELTQSAQERVDIRNDIRGLSKDVNQRLGTIELALHDYSRREEERTRLGRFIYLLSGSVISFLVLDWKDGWAKLSTLVFHQ